MHEISATTTELQANTNEYVNVNSRHRGFTQVDNIVDSYGLGRAVKDTFRKITRLIRMLGGVCDWHMRRIAACLEMKYETYRAHQRILKRVGLIEVIPRRIKGCRENMANLLRLVKGVVKNTQRREEKSLKTTTPAPEAAGSPPRRGKSEMQKLHEARFAQDRADSKWKREEYEAKASWWATMKAWMNRKIERERQRKAQITVGYNPTPPPTPEQEAEYLAMRERMDAVRIARIRAELEAKAEKERQRLSDRDAWIRRAYGGVAR